MKRKAAIVGAVSVLWVATHVATNVDSETGRPVHPVTVETPGAHGLGLPAWAFYEDGAVLWSDGSSACIVPAYGCTP